MLFTNSVSYLSRRFPFFFLFLLSSRLRLSTLSHTHRHSLFTYVQLLLLQRLPLVYFVSLVRARTPYLDMFLFKRYWYLGMAAGTWDVRVVEGLRAWNMDLARAVDGCFFFGMNGDGDEGNDGMMGVG